MTSKKRRRQLARERHQRQAARQAQLKKGGRRWMISILAATAVVARLTTSGIYVLQKEEP